MQIRMYPTEKADIKRAAKMAGMSLSDWVRNRLSKCAEEAEYWRAVRDAAEERNKKRQASLQGVAEK